jgi:uncharacterized LabA/DUF88 family protein
MQIRQTKRTAILVDGGFYRRKAQNLWGKKDAPARAEELFGYCLKHIHNNEDGEPRDLYRILYYDCPPMKGKTTHPLTGAEINWATSKGAVWTNTFFSELLKRRKVAVRRGELAEAQAHFSLKDTIFAEVISGQKDIKDLTEEDFYLDVKQKGVDMRIGLDVASMAYNKLVDQIILIAGDSDFVPVAKLARKSGIDVLLDPMKSHVKESLLEHVDGLESFT